MGNEQLARDCDYKNAVFVLATVIEIVLRAGDMQMKQFGKSFKIDKKSSIDLVTDVDLSVEKMFRDIIQERFPEHGILSEEFGERIAPGASELGASSASGCCWVFDPIDGTTNFAHGLPFFCSSLSFEIDGRPEVAAVYEPIRKELFVAERGKGASLNGRPLKVSQSTTLIDSLLCTGFPYDVHTSREELVGLFGHFLGRARAVRRLGSAALDLCYVAAGRLAGFWEQRLRAWDISAGSLIVEESGGQVTDLQGEVFSSRTGNVVASNGRIHETLIKTIQEFMSKSK